jgi:hypothetical protein
MVLDDLFNQLKKNDFHSFYFDRTSKGMLCDKKGWFSCEGPFDRVSGFLQVLLFT